MKKILFLMLFISSFCHSQEWIKIDGKDTVGGEWYISSKYLSKRGNIIKIWVKNIPSPNEEFEIRDEKGKSKIYKNHIVKELIEFDCLEKRYRLIVQDVKDSKGVEIWNKNYYSDWEYAVPNSTTLKLLYEICERFN